MISLIGHKLNFSIPIGPNQWRPTCSWKSWLERPLSWKGLCRKEIYNLTIFHVLTRTFQHKTFQLSFPTSCMPQWPLVSKTKSCRKNLRVILSIFAWVTRCNLHPILSTMSATINWRAKPHKTGRQTILCGAAENIIDITMYKMMPALLVFQLN